MAGSSGSLRIFVFVLVILFCVSLAGLAWAVQAVPQQAAREFGPADPNLTALKRFSLSVQLLARRDQVLEPANRGAGKQPVEIEMGESAQGIAEKLEALKLIGDSETFLLYLVYSGLDKTIQAGKYQLSAAMNLVEIADALQDATPSEVPFAILPGWRLEEIASALPTSGLEISPEAFLEMAKQPELSGLPREWVRSASLEGFLLPETYILPRRITVNELIGVFARRFQEAMTPDLVRGFGSQGLDVFQAVTLASIVQREAVVSEEQPMIASVFINRLNAGMSLDSDPTVQYSLGYSSEKQTWWKNPLSLDDLRVNSPYNTYLNAGLPPGPICAPSITALTAVAYPAQTPYYYFRAKCDGSGRHSFAVNYQEHINNACP
ncbi:MAG: endolytic transglycosylase MltG [Anaerolineae bacterium]|nr:endolytic transglycosylase MltG [Anaerolineae bacterium]